MTADKELQVFSNNAERILRNAVRRALRQHYRSGEYVVYYNNGKIYRTNKPGTKGTVVSPDKSKSA